MTSSATYGEALLCFLAVFFITQGSPQCNTRLSKTSDIRPPSCCLAASNGSISAQVDACFEQQANTFEDCEIHAYILVQTEPICYWCVDPRAPWLPNRLQKLKSRGIYCKPLTKPDQIIV